jgi:UDP-glucuronate 4-epimerase
MFKQKILKFDLCDSAKIEKVIANYKPDSVIHLAAQAGVRMPLKDFGKYVESNLLGFSNLIISSARFGIPFNPNRVETIPSLTTPLPLIFSS